MAVAGDDVLELHSQRQQPPTVGNNLNKMKSFRFILLIGIAFFSCVSTPDKKIRKVTVYDYQIQISNLDKKELRDSFVLCIDTSLQGSKINVLFKKVLDNSAFQYMYSIKDDSLFYMGTYCRIMDTVTVNYKDSSIELYKSEYDQKNSADEESYIYWNSKYGLISIYNYPCGALILFEYEKIPDFSKINFYNYIVEQEKNKKSLIKTTSDKLIEVIDSLTKN